MWCGCGVGAAIRVARAGPAPDAAPVHTPCGAITVRVPLRPRPRPQATCTWSTTVNGKSHNYDFRWVVGGVGGPCPACAAPARRAAFKVPVPTAAVRVCAPAPPCPRARSPLCLDGNSGDYVLQDGLGHDYYANICGYANQICLPQGWLATYETGVAVQMFGATPPCNRRDPRTLNCIEKTTQQPTCCTRDCQVLGVMDDTHPPTFTLVNASDPNGGVRARFIGAQQDQDDPFPCPPDPYTGEPMPRTVSMIFSCEPALTNAMPLLAVQNTTEDCE